TPNYLQHEIYVTLALIAFLGAIFLKGFKEAIGIAVLLVFAYLAFNLLVLSVGLYEVVTHPIHFPQWKEALLRHPSVHGNAWLVIAWSLMLFPKLALGLSGFETGVAVMPLIKGDSELGPDVLEDIHSTRASEAPEPRIKNLLHGRIQNTKKMLRTAALIMSVLLVSSS